MTRPIRFLVAALISASLAATSACTLGGKPDGSAKAAQQAVTNLVREALPAAAGAVDGTKLEADASWAGCPGGLGHQYSGGASLWAPPGDVAEQLTAVEAALTSAGYDVITNLAGQVSIKRGAVSLTIKQPAPRDPKMWRVFFDHDCGRYSSDDEEFIDADPGDDFAGLTPGLAP